MNYKREELVKVKGSRTQLEKTTIFETVKHHNWKYRISNPTISKKVRIKKYLMMPKKGFFSDLFYLKNRYTNTEIDRMSDAQENKHQEFHITNLEDVSKLRKFVSENRIEVVTVRMNYADGVRSFVVRVF